MNAVVKKYKELEAKAIKLDEMRREIQAKEEIVQKELKKAWMEARALVQTNGYGASTTMRYNGRVLKARQNRGWVAVSENGKTIDKFFRSYAAVEMSLVLGEI